jgi:hypothetical protein
MVELKRRKQPFDHLRASSILEVTVALVILSISFSIFLIIHLNVTSGSRYFQRIKYESRIAMAYNELIRTGDYTDQVVTEGTVKIFRSVTPYPGQLNLKTIRLKAVSENGKILAEYKTLLYVAD